MGFLLLTKKRNVRIKQMATGPPKFAPMLTNRQFLMASLCMSAFLSCVYISLPRDHHAIARRRLILSDELKNVGWSEAPSAILRPNKITGVFELQIQYGKMQYTYNVEDLSYNQMEHPTEGQNLPPGWFKLICNSKNTRYIRYRCAKTGELFPEGQRKEGQDEHPTENGTLAPGWEKWRKSGWGKTEIYTYYHPEEAPNGTVSHEDYCSKTS